MSAGPADLFDAAQQLLDAAAAALAGPPTPIGGPIAYQAIWPGLPVWDCAPALFVHAGGPRVGDTMPLSPPLQPMQRISTTGEVNLLSLTVTVLRCVPTLEQTGQTIALPQPVKVTAAARETYEDVWAIWNWLKNRHRDGSLFQVPSGRREFAFAPAVPVHTSGGIGGWEIPILVQLGGYNDPVDT